MIRRSRSNDLIPRPTGGPQPFEYDLVLAAQPYRSRTSAETKVKNVLAPLAKALAPAGRLVVVQSTGHDPGMEIIRRIWPAEDPFATPRHKLIKELDHQLNGDTHPDFGFEGTSDAASLFTLPPARDAQRGVEPDQHLDHDGGVERSGVRRPDRGRAHRRRVDGGQVPRCNGRRGAEARRALVSGRVVRRGTPCVVNPQEQVVAHLRQLGVDHEIVPCDPALADTAAFCEAYGYSPDDSANTIIVVGKGETPRPVACVVLASTRLDVNGVVRKRLEVRKASFASADETMQLTGMEIGGVTAFALADGTADLDRRRGDGT